MCTCFPPSPCVVLRFSVPTVNIYYLLQYNSMVQNNISSIQLASDDRSLYNSLNTDEAMTTQEMPHKEIISISYQIYVL